LEKKSFSLKQFKGRVEKVSYAFTVAPLRQLISPGVEASRARRRADVGVFRVQATAGRGKITILIRQGLLKVLAEKFQFKTFSCRLNTTNDATALVLSLCDGRTRNAEKSLEFLIET
jgi:hypothetical protein